MLNQICYYQAESCVIKEKRMLAAERRDLLVEPGVVTCSRWRPDVMEIGETVDVTHFGGVARRT